MNRKNIYRTALFFLTVCIFFFSGCADYYHGLSGHVKGDSSSDASITSFSFHPHENPGLDIEFSGKIIKTNDEIWIVVPPGWIDDIGLTLKPRFTTRGLAYVNGDLQDSGSSEQSFTDAVVYNVVSANGANTKQYTVNILEKASRIYVDLLAEEGGDGSSWENAFSSLHEANEIASLFHENMEKEIWITAGLYKPGGEDDKDAYFKMTANTSYIGGFSGTESNINQRNPANKTKVSGDLGNGQRSINLFACFDGANRDITFNGFEFEQSNTAIKAFLASPSQLRIINCSFSNLNTAVFSYNARSVIINDSTIENINTSGSFGAVHVDGTRAAIADVNFNNITGDALSIIAADVSIENSNFNNITGTSSNNQAIYINQKTQSGTININNVKIDTVTDGRGVYVSSHTSLITNSVIKNCNIDNDFGGGIHLVNSRKAEISFIELENTSALTGGGIYYDGSAASSSLLVKNVKIDGDTADQNHQLMHLFGNNIVVNNIIP